MTKITQTTKFVGFDSSFADFSATGDKLFSGFRFFFRPGQTGVSGKVFYLICQNRYFYCNSEKRRISEKQFINKDGCG
jgi:hypothetical protein